MSTHAADPSRRALDDRGYSGPLLRGANPATLLERGVVDRITESYYYKEQCFGLNAATLCDRAVELTHIGGTYGDMGRPTPFLCLVFVALTLVPEKEVVRAWLDWPGDEGYGSGENEAEGEEENGHGEGGAGEKRARRTKGHFKYLRALAAFYIRLAWEPVEIFKTLEPLLGDYRKLRQRTRDGFKLSYVDQFVDDLLTKDRVCATSLWKLPPRMQLEDLDMLDPYVSPIQDEVDALDEEDERRSDGRSDRGSEEGERSDSRD